MRKEMISCLKPSTYWTISLFAIFVFLISLRSNLGQPSEILKCKSGSQDSTLEDSSTNNNIVYDLSVQNSSSKIDVVVDPDAESKNIEKILEALHYPETPQFSFRHNAVRLDDRKFLAIGRLSEQISKARLHLAEILQMAKGLNRTFILPLVEKGRLGSSYDYQLPFSAYFDVGKLGEYVDWVTEDYFMTQVLPRRNNSVGVITAFFKDGGLQCDPIGKLFHHMTRFESDSRDGVNVTQSGRRNFLTTNFRLNNTGSESNKDEEEEAEYLRKHTSSHALECFDCYFGIQVEYLTKHASHYDVVVVQKATVVSCMTEEKRQESLVYLEYAPQLHAEFQKIQNKLLGPNYLAIHWRSEKAVYAFGGPYQNDQVTACMEGLLSNAKELTDAHGLSSVFLATDVDVQEAKGKKQKFKSSSMANVWKENPQLLEFMHDSLLDVIDKLEARTSEAFLPKYGLLDSGIQGILDKLICTYSTYFMYPPNNCGAEYEGKPASSFTREVMSTRVAIGFKNHTNIIWK